MTSEDDTYRWDVSTNSLSQALALSPASVSPMSRRDNGPDGTVFTLNGARCSPWAV
jgi:hypothetical protein